MSEWKNQDFNELTVMQLRKVAKAMGVPLGAGISKAGIVAKLENARDNGSDAPVSSPAESSDAAEASSAPGAESKDDDVSAPEASAESVATADAPAVTPTAPATPAAPATPTAPATPAPAAQDTTRSAFGNFRPAYQAPANPRFSAKPAYQSSSAPYNNRPRMNNDLPRTQTVRPNNYTPRFGPAAQEPARPEDDQRSYRADTRPSGGYWNDRRPSYNDAPADRRASYNDAPADRRPSYNDAPRPAYGAEPTRPSYNDAPRYTRPSYDAAPAGFDSPRRPVPSYAAAPQREFPSDPMMTPSTVNDMLTAAECQDGSGILELHPDGYGFLRGRSLLPSNRDIYVSMAQVRRFSLRTGDSIVGKVRPQRDGDKYSAMLYITEINGIPADQLTDRPAFEDLTPCYPRERITLEAKTGDHTLPMRLIDLIAPIGFGQRSLIHCPPEANKTDLLADIANAISTCHPDTVVMALLLGGTPEDATQLRDVMMGEVISSTFDQTPENHLRTADLVLERAERLVEMKKDVVLLVDNLTYLAKVFTTAASQTGRQTIGMVNPASLQRAKRIFGAARCVREGGSLTVFAMMNVDNGNRVDDSIAEDLKGTANMELVLDNATAHAGIYPPVNLMLSTTRRADLIATPEQLEGIALIREMLSSLRAVDMIPQLLSMLEKTETNSDLLVRIKDWAALMKQ